MTLVETVLGPVDSLELGITYMHEHIFVLTPDAQMNYPHEWGDEDARVDDAVLRLRELASRGVKTIVDPTVVGLGRYIPRIVRVAERVPELNIVVATGVYTYDRLPWFFQFRPAEAMTEAFLSDITEGIAGTRVRAGLLKCAVDYPGLTGGVERVIRSIAAAHLATGTPVMVHTHPGSRNGLDVKRLLCDELGVAPEHVLLAHSGDTSEWEHLVELAEAGFVLGMDRFGLNFGISFEERAAVLIEMCRRGFAGSMVLSHDASCYIDWMEPATRAALNQWHYLHLSDDVIPYVKERGVTGTDLELMLREVPRRFLAGSLEEVGQ